MGAISATQRACSAGAGGVLGALREDIATARANDPAARSALEVFLSYPGLHAVWFHRAAHRLWAARLRLAARMVAQFARFLTGVDIHPGATIGRRLFIDHAIGVVIGETAVIGDDVMLYHGVTLGRKAARGREYGTKRHPTLEDGVTVGAGAKIIGDIVVGRGSIVGANAVLGESVPPYSLVVGIPARVTPLRETRTGPALHHQREG